MTSNIDTAMKHFEHALSLDSNHEGALDGLASCLFLKGQYEQALESFQRTNSGHTATLGTLFIIFREGLLRNQTLTLESRKEREGF